VLPSGQKLTLGLLTTIILEVVPFCTYAPFPTLLPFLKCILKSCSVGGGGVQHRLWFCIDHLNCVKTAAFQLYLRLWKQKKYGGWWTTVILFLVKSSLVKYEMWDGALSWCNSQFFFAEAYSKILAHFHTVAVKHHSSMWNWLFGLPGLIICEQSLWCQRKWWACSWLCSSPVSRLSVSVSLDFQCMAYAFFHECLSSHCQGLCRICSQICTKFDAVPLSDPSQNQHFHPAAWNCAHRLLRYASTIH
jgi:hypothetical protein